LKRQLLQRKLLPKQLLKKVWKILKSLKELKQLKIKQHSQQVKNRKRPKLNLLKPSSIGKRA
jgi:hypothetical protein